MRFPKWNHTRYLKRNHLNHPKHPVLPRMQLPAGAAGFCFAPDEAVCLSASLSAHLRTHLSLWPRTTVCLPSPIAACCNKAWCGCPSLSTAGLSQQRQTRCHPWAMLGRVSRRMGRQCPAGGERGDLPFFPVGEGAAMIGKCKNNLSSLFFSKIASAVCLPALWARSGNEWKGNW